MPPLACGFDKQPVVWLTNYFEDNDLRVTSSWFTGLLLRARYILYLIFMIQLVHVSKHNVKIIFVKNQLIRILINFISNK